MTTPLTTPLDFNRLAEDAHATARAKGFYDEPRSRLEALALIMSEVGEAVEGARKPGPDAHLPEFENFHVELADAVIRIADLAEAEGVDLAAIILAKMAYNETRPYRHGKLI
jgi:NTP pyrophosphatase (non-canonical NTP hydrolase)